ncbi:SRPBCC family protein [Inhella proteolytica]|uniref:SRPBCC domain-containing protein n=1 Tax=Inhella proteolytica TaxID=2795029 RepID=A0A931NFU2_9BURK|nr:SRPBCC domain-containing protein [Inhella proteolytica]MBH9579182.1 SRPBCC domain-containing protein [Inhella proteolytica]
MTHWMHRLLLRGSLLGLLLAAPLLRAAEPLIEHRTEVAASPAELWQAWTTREGLRSFFAPDARIDPRPGGLFEIHFNPYMPEGQRGADGLRLLALQPEQMLSFEWNAPPHLPEVRAQRTVVIVRFEALGEGRTRVTLSHLGWGSGGQWDEARAYFGKAWSFVLGNLNRRFAEAKPIDWTPWLARLKAEAERAAKS